MTYQAAFLAGLSWPPVFSWGSWRSLKERKQSVGLEGIQQLRKVGQQMIWVPTDFLRIKDTRKPRSSQ